MIHLKKIDDVTLQELLVLAVSEADPKEVMPPADGPDGWNEARKAAFCAFYESRRDGEEIMFAILRDGRVMGSGRLARVSPGMFETGMWLARSARGHGIGSQALLALKKQAVADGATRLIARTTSSNLGALGALQNCGAEIGAPDALGKIEAVFAL